MSTADLAFVTAMLKAQRDRCHEDLVALDAAISRLDALHDAALEAEHRLGLVGGSSWV